MIEPGASSGTVAWMVAAAFGGVVVAMVGAWAKAQIERIGGAEDRIERNHERDTERTIDHVQELATLRAEVALLKEDRKRCDELAERMARQEAFQSWSEPLLERAVDGLQRIAAFEARLDSDLKTIFKAIGAITQRLERNGQMRAA